MALGKYEKWLKHKEDKFKSTLYDKIVQELMTLGGVAGTENTQIVASSLAYDVHAYSY